MGQTNSLKNDLLKLILQAIPIATIADNAASSPTTVIQASLHTALPTTQTTFLAAYTEYSHANVARSIAGWSVDVNTHEGTNAVNVLWPLCGDPIPVAYPYVGLSLSGVLRFTVLMTEPILVSTGVQPRVLPGVLKVRAV